MRGHIGLLGSLLALQLVVAAVLLLADAGLGQEDQSSFLSIDKADINRMNILDSEGNEVTLQRVTDEWQLSLPPADGGETVLPADQTKVSEVLDTLLDVRALWPVGTTTDARERFEVTEDAFQRMLSLSDADGEVVEVFLGTSPGYRRVHARANDSDEVYSIDFSNYQLPATAGDWLDSSLLGALGEIERIERIEQQGGWVLTRDDEGWLVDGLAADQDAASQLADRLGSLRVTGLAEVPASGEVAGTGSTAAVDFLVTDGEGRYRLAFRGSTDGSEYVVTSDRHPGGFTVAAYIAEQLVLDVEELSATAEASDGDGLTE